jgi:hypothetical protein
MRYRAPALMMLAALLVWRMPRSAILAEESRPSAAPAPKPDVVFAEDFDHFDPKRWDEVSEAPGVIQVVDGGPRDDHGNCLQVTATLGKDTGGHLYKMLDPGLDECHVRFYVKFEKDHGYVHHFFHLVGYNPPTRWPQGGAGDRPRGDERFSTGVEPWGFWGKYPPPGAWNFYSYWCEMKRSPDGKYWGNSFAPKEPQQIPTDRWICVEIMLKCNSAPDKADGEQAMWIDGKEVGRWGDFKWRTDSKLKVNGLWLLDYITELAPRQNSVKDPRKVNRAWFDDVVVSKSYIGPKE